MVKQFRLDKDLAEQLKETADILNKTESEFIREAIMEHISRYIAIDYMIDKLIKKYNMNEEDIIRLKETINKMIKENI